MQFTAREWMNELVVYVDAENTIAEALALMRRRYVNSLIIKKSKTNPDNAILTSTDILVKIIAQEHNPNEVKVKEIMISPIITVSTHTPLKECAALMKEKQIHNLPVLDDCGEVVGMLTATDFLVAAEAMASAPGERIV